MIYLTTCYRWGWRNGHTYIIYCGTDATKARAMAQAERDDRGGKYGCEVTRFAENGETWEVDSYFGSSYGEDEPEMNWTIEAMEHIGHVATDYAEGRARVPSGDEHGTMKLIVVEPPPILVDLIKRARERYDTIAAAWAEARANNKRGAELAPPGTREGIA